MIKNLPAMQETWVQSLGQELPLEKKMATYSSILAWKMPCTEEPGRLQSMGSQKQKSLSLIPSDFFSFFLFFFVFFLFFGHATRLPGS